MLAIPALLKGLSDALGAWTVSGPARHAVQAAFNDIAWQHAMRVQLEADSARLAALLDAQRLSSHRTPLFAWAADARAHALHHALAQRGVWTRFFPQPASVRFGLPASEAEWTRLEHALIDSVRESDAMPDPLPVHR